MTIYKCNDCSFKGKRMQQGRCPACGSANIQRQADAKSAEKEDKYKKIKMAAMLIAWAIFGFEVLRLLSR